MYVVVTGASGYIGSHVVDELLRHGHRVMACDLNSQGIDKRAEFSQINVLSGSPDLYEELSKPDLLLHMAWRQGFVHNAPAHMEYLSSHYTFLRNMALAGCQRIAVMGTMHEVGYWEGAIDENTPCVPLSQYGIAKNALRQSTMLLSKEIGFNLYWLRAFYIYGDDAHGSSIFSKITRAATEGKTTFPFTKGTNKFDFIHVAELAKQIVAAATQDEVTGIINTCCGKPVKLSEKVESYIQDNELNIQLLYGVYPDRPYDSPAVWGDATKIQQIMEAGKA